MVSPERFPDHFCRSLPHRASPADVGELQELLPAPLPWAGARCSPGGRTGLGHGAPGHVGRLHGYGVPLVSPWSCGLGRAWLGPAPDGICPQCPPRGRAAGPRPGDAAVPATEPLLPSCSASQGALGRGGTPLIHCKCQISNRFWPINV